MDKENISDKTSNIMDDKKVKKKKVKVVCFCFRIND